MFRLRLVPVSLLALSMLVFVPPATAAPGGVSVDSFSQCLNGGPPSASLACASWSSGAINASNSHYGEDQVIPQRLALSLPAGNASHTVTLTYLARKGGVHAYDSLATWNTTQTSASPCQGIAASICAGSPTTFPMTSDSTPVLPAGAGISATTSAHELAASDRQWTMYGGTITASSTVTHSAAGTPASDDVATVTLTFHNNSASAGSAILLFGGHLAVTGAASIPRAWGTGLGASSISGGPYHISLGPIDGSAAGSRSSGIQAGAVTPLAPAAFTVTKTADDTTAVPGQPVTYTVTVTNNGETSGSTTFTDDFADSLDPSAVTSDPTGGSCTGSTTGNRTISCTTGTIAGGGSQTFTYTAAMPDTFSGASGGSGCAAGSYPIDNTVTLADGNADSVTVCVDAASAFTVTKTADDETPAPGQSVEYTITVANTGAAAGSTTFVDDFSDRLDPSAVTSNPVGGSCVAATTGNEQFDCTTGTIAAGGTQTFTYTAVMPATFSGESGGSGCEPGSYPIGNTATLADGDADSVTVCVGATPAFTVAKTADDSGAGPGQTIAYTITVTNTGAAAGSTTFVDDFNDRLDPSAVTSDPTGGSCVAATTGNEQFDCTTGTIAAGGTQTFTYTAVMPATYTGDSGGAGCEPGSYPIGNTVTLDGGDTDSVTVCVAAAPELTVTKTADDETAVPGQVVEYTITVANTGAAAGSTTFVDDFSDRLDPSAVTSDPVGGSCVAATTGNEVFDCTTGTIAGGAQQTFTYTAVMPTTFSGDSGGAGCVPGSYPIGNTVTLDLGPSDSVTVCVDAAASFTVTKAADDLTAVPGQVVEYTITVANTGSAAGSTTFVDDFSDRIDPSAVTSDPSGGTCVATTSGNEVLNCSTGTIAAGGTQTFSYTAVMPDSFSGDSGGAGCEPGSYPVGNTVTLANDADDAVTVCVEAAPEFTVAKSVNDETPSPGETVTYTITVTNGGDAAGSTTFVDDFSDGVDPSAVTSDPATGVCERTGGANDTFACQTGTIDAGDAQTFTYDVAIPTTFTGSPGGLDCPADTYPIDNTVTLAGGDDAAVVVCVDAAPDLTVTKTADTTSTTPGQDVNYTITVTNNGSAPGATTFVDDFDDALEPSAVTSDPDGGTCVATTTGNELFTCETGTIAAGGQQTFSYTAAMPDSFIGASGGGDCAEGSYPVDNTVSLTGGDSDTVTVCVDAMSSFTVSKSVDDESAVAGQTVAYTITVTNTGSAPGSTTFVDDFSDRLDPSDVTSDPTGGSCVATTAGNEVFNCSTGTIGAGDTQAFSYTAVMPATFSGDSGGSECTPGSYPIGNSVTLEDGPADSVTVCVDAAADFTVSKSVDIDTAVPGQTVAYTITVTNTGSAPGSTTFVDDFSDRLDPSDPVSGPAGGSCVATTTGNEVFTCSTGTIGAGDQQTFRYTAVMPATFSGDSGGSTCVPGSYPIGNAVTLDGGADDAVTVCVEAAPDLTVTKAADDETPEPGQTVEYTITVSNTGSAPGATTFVDDFSDRLEPSDVTSDPSGASCVATTTGNEQFDCATGTIEAGDQQTFTYTAVMPATFSGDSGGEGCGPGSYPIGNTVTLDGGNADAVTVCVEASPDLRVTKTVDNATAEPGATVAYTITVSNDGSAPGSTTFVDDFSDRLDPSDVTSDPTGGSCVETTTGSFDCQTSTVEAGGSQTFTYTAVMPATFTGDSGGAGCEPGSYPIGNTVTLDGGDADAVTVCVVAAPEFAVTKAVDDESAAPGETVEYTITVSNTGSAPGSTTFVDDFSDRLDPSEVVSDPAGSSCVETTAGNEVLTCETGDIEAGEAGEAQTFTYTAAMPDTFTGVSGGGECADGSYPIGNTVTLDGGQADSATVCVDAAPSLHLSKSYESDTDNSGNQFLTYTITYTNTGPAEATTANITDAVPAGTAFASCTDDCVVAGMTPSASWTVGPIAPLTGEASVTLTVEVTSNQTCQISNTAQIVFGSAPPVSSNTVVVNVTPRPDVTGAHANGSAKGAQVATKGLLNLLVPANNQALSAASSSQSGLGGPQLDNESLVSAKVPGSGSLLKAGVLNTTSASQVTSAPAAAHQTSTAEVANVCVLPIGGLCTVETGTVRAVASTDATGSSASYSTAGSTIQNLKIVGLATPVNLNQTTKIPLSALVFGSGSYVAIGERSGPSGAPEAGLTGDMYAADVTVTMIHVKITGLLGVQAAEVIVAQATAHSDFPQTFVCAAASTRSVSGHAFVASLSSGPLVADLVQGFTQVSPLGGSETERVAALKVPANGSIVSAQAADGSSIASIDSTRSTSTSIAEIAGDQASPACVLRTGAICVAEATAIRSEAHSTATSAGSTSNDAGTTIAGLRVLGLPVSVTSAPNGSITLPGIGFIVLNEQVCDGGAVATHTCSGSTHSGITVRALRVVVTVASNLLGLQPGIELIVAEAHADSTFS